jgi:hypothetical protein
MTAALYALSTGTEQEIRLSVAMPLLLDSRGEFFIIYPAKRWRVKVQNIPIPWTSIILKEIPL